MVDYIDKVDDVNNFEDNDKIGNYDNIAGLHNSECNVKYAT